MIRPLAPKDDSQSPPNANNPAEERKGTKRKCVPSACVPCRKRKSKCDGSTPICSTCTHVYRTECYYDADAPNRRSRFAKKEAPAPPDRNGALDIIIASIKSLPETDVVDIINQIRTDDNLDALADSLRKVVTLPRKSDSQTLEGDFSVIMGKPQLSGAGVTRHWGHTSSLGLVHDEEIYTKPFASCAAPHTETWTSVTNDLEFVNHLLSLYFSWSHPFYPLLSKERFYADFHNKRAKYCSQLLVNALCACACHFSDRPAARTNPDDPRTAGDLFFTEARKLLFDDETSSLTTVQALSIMSIREGSSGRDSSGFQYMGRSLRMALEIGLHLSYIGADNLNLTQHEVEVRKITFWGCFFLDTAWSMCVGRISQLPRVGIDLEKPSPSDSHSNERWKAYTDFNVQGIELPDNSLRFSHQISTLSEIVSDTVYMFYAPRERFTSRKVLDCYSKLQSWYNALPESLKIKSESLNDFPSPHLLMLHMYYWTCVLHLFRPLLKVDLMNSNVNPRDVCTRCANKISEYMDIYRRIYGLRRMNVLITHILLSSCTVHLLNLPSESASHNLSQGLKDLETISTNHYFAARSFKIIYMLSRDRRINLPEDILRTSHLVHVVASEANHHHPPPPTAPPPPQQTKQQSYIKTTRITPSANSQIDTTSTSPTPQLDGYAMPPQPSQTPSTYGTQAHPQSPAEKIVNPNSASFNFASSSSRAPSRAPQQQNTTSNGSYAALAPAPTAATAITPTTASVMPNSTSTAANQHPASQLFWSPFPAGQGIPLIGNNNVSPMDLSAMLGSVDDWEQFQRDGFRMSDVWGQSGFVFGLEGGGAGAAAGQMIARGAPEPNVSQANTQASPPTMGFGQWWSDGPR